MKSLQITRVFDAPRELVFSWWTEGRKMQQWSGCKEATRCEIQMDFRVGGGFTQKMQIGGKGEFTITAKYDEIVVPERIVYHVNLGFGVTRVVLEFLEQGDKTKIVLTQEGFPDDFLSQTVSHGTTESFDKLDSILASESRVI
ncbi:MAG TPA: SRPBCC domain-containing protein [Bryobacteraceae bacterium]|jgi:uncharacterized protein YndB with AHSA1/START domain|nr:SRPBCC domain-containing protein [Bryobacteraceae bacterium]